MGRQKDIGYYPLQPRKVVYDFANTGRAHPEFKSQFFLRDWFCGVTISDFLHLIESQFRHSVSLPSIACSVSNSIHLVSRKCVPTKVYQTSVCANSVVMSSFITVWAESNEGQQHQSMHGLRLLPIVATEDDKRITTHCYGWSQNPIFRFSSPSIFLTDYSSQRSHASEIRNLIESFVARYRFPKLCGRLSVVHARPFMMRVNWRALGTTILSALTSYQWMSDA